MRAFLIGLVIAQTVAASNAFAECNVVCNLAGVNGRPTVDAGRAINACIQQVAPAAWAQRQTVCLGAGTYYLQRQIKLDVPNITLQTTSPVDCRSNRGACANLIAASNLVVLAPDEIPAGYSAKIGNHDTGLIEVSQNNVHLISLVVDGNKAARYPAYRVWGGPNGMGREGQQQGWPQWTYLPQRDIFVGKLLGETSRISGFVLQYSQVINAVNISGLGTYAALDNSIINDNLIGYNGYRPTSTSDPMFPAGISDGFTLFDGTGDWISGNLFYDNTDISLDIGGCANCVISNNEFWQSGAPGTGTHTQVSLNVNYAYDPSRGLDKNFYYPWPSSGSFSNTQFIGNWVASANAYASGGGFEYGPGIWYPEAYDFNQISQTSFHGHPTVVRNYNYGITINGNVFANQARPFVVQTGTAFVGANQLSARGGPARTTAPSFFCAVNPHYAQKCSWLNSVIASYGGYAAMNFSVDGGTWVGFTDPASAAWYQTHYSNLPLAGCIENPVGPATNCQ